MTNHILKGRMGEETAVKFLLLKGYQILERNWRFGRKELDIIARDRDINVFLEVKSRRTMGDERYDELVNQSKQRAIISAANAYMIGNSLTGEMRFDVVFIIGQGDEPHIEHIENAFTIWG